MFVQVLHIFRERIVSVTDEYRVVPASAIVAKSPALRGNFLPEEHLDSVNLKQNELEQIDGTEKRKRLENTNVESKTVAMLKDILKENDIDFQKTNKKQDLINRLKKYSKQI